MRVVSIVKAGDHQLVRLPRDMVYKGVGKLEITKEGDVITLRPARQSWPSLADLPGADADFLQERPAIIGRQDQDELRNKLRGSVIFYVDPFEPVD